MKVKYKKSKEKPQRNTIDRTWLRFCLKKTGKKYIHNSRIHASSKKTTTRKKV